MNENVFGRSFACLGALLNMERNETHQNFISAFEVGIFRSVLPLLLEMAVIISLQKKYIPILPDT